MKITRIEIKAVTDSGVTFNTSWLTHDYRATKPKNFKPMPLDGIKYITGWLHTINKKGKVK